MVIGHFSQRVRSDPGPDYHLCKMCLKALFHSLHLVKIDSLLSIMIV